MPLLATASALMISVTLLATGLGHLRFPLAFRRQLIAQGIPSSAVLGVAMTSAIAEVAIGLGGLWSTGVARVPYPFAAGTVLLSIYAVWLQRLRVRRPGSPCGCSRVPTSIDGPTVLRATVLAAVSLVAMIGVEAGQRLSLEARSATAVLVGVTASVLLWNLPGALRQLDGAAVRGNTS